MTVLGPGLPVGVAEGEPAEGEAAEGEPAEGEAADGEAAEDDAGPLLLAAGVVLAGADFGAGLWTLLSLRSTGPSVRDHARHAMGPVWEANHVWLIFVLVVCWTGYPVAFGSITSTLAAPVRLASSSIISPMVPAP